MRSSGCALVLAMVLLVQFAGCQGEQAAGLMREAPPAKLEALLPTAGELGEWGLPVVKVYNPDDLFQYIDGEAQAFLGYDFVELLSARYVHVNAPDRKLVIDIYDMGNLDNAFGIYSLRRSPEAKFLQVGMQGYVAEGELEFWKGRFFVDVEVRGLESGADEEAARVARLVDARIPASADRPALAGLLPKEHQSPNTLVYYRRNVLGYGFLENGLQASYRSGDNSWELVVCQFDSGLAALEAFSKLKDGWSKMAEFKGKVDNLAEAAFALQDGYYDKVIIFRSGRFVGIGLWVKSQPAFASLEQFAVRVSVEK